MVKIVQYQPFLFTFLHLFNMITIPRIHFRAFQDGKYYIPWMGTVQVYICHGADGKYAMAYIYEPVDGNRGSAY